MSLSFRAPPSGLADLLGREPTKVESLAVGGTSARGARPAAHLMTAMTSGGRGHLVAGAGQGRDRQVTMTADALHTERGHARFLVEVKKTHYALTTKENQQGVCAQFRALP